ncbi:hypothetical protein FSP39_015433 [Pinctada imbricata]|uniref:ubiquitinyl hydrolase 1 n=1 Tax=Pinctada imbricata TaxID=66713 RepID=A0AA88XID0_PINIB|nr:hypothetical protein FSP39_015433 [Pinctada imbricata]
MSNQNDSYYILLKEKIGKKKEKGILRTTSSKVEILPGTLLCLIDEETRDSRIIWVLETVDSDNNHVEVSCAPNDTGQLTYNEFRLLLPIPVCQERLSIFQDQNWLKEGASLIEGEHVLVSLKGLPDLPGTIRYKGELPSSKGIQFGVELAPEHRGKGTCDGVFRKKRFFTCDTNSAVFVAIHKLRKDVMFSSQHRHLEQNVYQTPHIDNDERKMIDQSGLRIDDRIVWLSDNGPEFGVVKWIGILPDTHRRDVTVGVEFDNPVGSGTGKYKNHRLFFAKPQHASLVPILGLMKASEYLQSMGATNESYPEPEIEMHPPPVIPSHLQPTPVNRMSSDSFLKISFCSHLCSILGSFEYIVMVILIFQMDSPYPPREPFSPRRSMEDQPQTQGVNPLYEYQKAQDYSSRVEPGSGKDSYEQLVSRNRNNGSKSLPPADPDLEVGSMVEVMANPPLYGVIRWIGTLPDQKEPIKPIAGLEMEEEISAGTDGTFGKHKLFACPPKKAFFVPLYKCRKDKRFQESGARGGMGNNFGSIETPDVGGNISPPDSLDVEMIVKNVCGKQKGIQGHHNSCYLDATLFAMFYFTTVFDGILYRPRTKEDLPEYEDVKQVLKEGIVNPLRRYNYVRADKVMKLRHLLDKLGNIPGMMNEEKDPEEFLNLLLGQITCTDPLLHIRQDDCKEIQQSFLYQLFIEKDERLVLPTTQQLFELSFLQSKVKLQERPSCLILQMPRFGKDYKMYKRIVPSMELDITDVLENAPRECIICGDLAYYECKECYNTHGAGLNTIAFCESCKDTSHRHKVRVNHKWQRIAVPEEFIEIHNQQKKMKGQHPSIPREKMELFAVVCIQTSHYVSFVKCGKGKEAPWVFFDSMADRMGEQSGYNIPEVKFCQDLLTWLSEESHSEIIQRKDDKELPEDIRRLLCDGYMCLYQSIEVSMFK